jgi:hypothetical protein
MSVGYDGTVGLGAIHLSDSNARITLHGGGDQVLGGLARY